MSIKNHQISTRTELIHEQFRLAGSSDALSHIRAANQFPLLMIDRFRICPNLDECLAQLLVDDRLAVAVSKRHAMNSRRVPKQKIYCFDQREHIMDYPVSVWAVAGNPWIRRFNEHSRWALEGGLIAKWYADSRTLKQKKHSATKGPEVLTMQHIYGALLLYLLFFLFSIGAFIAEHIINYHMQKPSPNRFWRWADMMIDGKRHFLMPEDVFPKKRKPQQHRVTFRRPTHKMRFGRLKSESIEMLRYRHAC